MANVTSMIVRVLPDGAPIALKGRVAWAVHCLWRAGNGGCTPIENPGPRWSDYTFKARKAGLDIQTVTEGHGGTYSGHHARYVLRSPIEVLELQEAGASS